MARIKVLPVIHHLDAPLSRDEVALALEHGADGVFLISHRGDDQALQALAAELVVTHGAERIGVNFLSRSFSQAFTDACEAGVGMIWTDRPHISGTGYGAEAAAVQKAIGALGRSGSSVPEVFGSVAFKYQSHEPEPAQAAATCADLGFIATTSGAATGSAPDLAKIKAMRNALGDRPLAIASGLTAKNLPSYRSLVTHALVATGISKDEYRIDPDKLAQFLEVAKTIVSSERDPP